MLLQLLYTAPLQRADSQLGHGGQVAAPASRLLNVESVSLDGSPMRTDRSGTPKTIEEALVRIKELETQ